MDSKSGNERNTEIDKDASGNLSPMEMFTTAPRRLNQPGSTVMNTHE